MQVCAQRHKHFKVIENVLLSTYKLKQLIKHPEICLFKSTPFNKLFV